MARITLRQLLDHAAERGYGVPAFNINNMEQGLAIMEAAEATDSPVIIQASRGARAYANDVVTLTDVAFDAMAGVEVLIVDAMRFRPHPTHAHLERALEWIDRIRPKRAFLTNLHVDMDYAELDRLTPPSFHTNLHSSVSI